MLIIVCLLPGRFAVVALLVQRKSDQLLTKDSFDWRKKRHETVQMFEAALKYKAASW